jgi:hypothetical protein
MIDHLNQRAETPDSSLKDKAYAQLYSLEHLDGSISVNLHVQSNSGMLAPEMESTRHLNRLLHK